MRRKVQKYIEEKFLFGGKDRVLVALSGGADSVALFRVLVSLGFPCECAHCNFHLRGEESDRDEAFVRDLCDQFEVPLHVMHFDTEDYAKTHRLSIEMAARELRYRWFESLRKEVDASVVAVAHHRDDSVETMLLNLIRGTGINGLKGISPKNGYIVRPLLEVSRQEILDYLQVIGQDYITDSTNLQDEYLRNKIRLNILPLMQEINPSVLESISETGARLSEVAAIYHRNRASVIAEKLETLSETSRRIAIADVLNDVAPLSLLHEILYPLGFNHGQIKDIYHSLSFSQSGKRFLSKEWEVLRDRQYLLIERLNQEKHALEIEMEFLVRDASFVLPRDKEVACLDADKVAFPLVVRKWQKGDFFVPLGMKGKKLVSDYLTDKKFTLHQKENQFVVCSGDDLVWLVNERIDNRFCVTDDTRRVLLLKVKR